MTAPLEATARRDLYALTARLFMAEVDVALYRALAVQDALGLIDVELSAMGEEQALEALAVEFCRLFIGPQPLCVPYASAHRGEALLGGRAPVWRPSCTASVSPLMQWRCASPRRIISQSSWLC
jgi:TorA maturation chaperone TorD